jgi:hypothetical protein
MKKSFLYILFLAVVIAACDPSEVKNEEMNEEASTKVAGTYGASVEESDVKTVAQMYQTVESEGEFKGKVIGEIKEVCVKKGCWLTLTLPDGQVMCVNFKDYGFFVPTDSQGYPVILEGIATKNTTDVETLRHYAEDAGKSKEEIEAITAPKEEYAFEAVGVIIKENA